MTNTTPDNDAFTTPWLRDVLRFAMRASASTPVPWETTEDGAWGMRAGGGGDLADPDDPGRDPRFRKLVEAILYSRRFCNTYNLVLLGVLGVFAIWHWSEKMVLHRKKRRVQARMLAVEGKSTRTEEEEAWSSSSSTISGTGTPPTVKHPDSADERTALIPSARRSASHRSPLWKPYNILKSCLQYQPRPIPLIHKTLPSNATSLVVLSYLALTLFYNLHNMPLSFTYLFVLADRCGILFIANLPLLYLLAAKNQPLQFLTGYSYESLNILHRRVGEIVCLEAFIHFVGMVGVWWGLLRHLGFTLAKFILNRVVLCGLGAIIAYEVIYFTSLGSFRKRWYEIFLATHIMLQVAGLVFLWFHHHTARPYVGISLAIFLVDRLVYRFYLRSSTHPATLTILEDDETLLVSANWDLVPNPTFLAPGNMTNGWSPNEHIFISVPALGRTHVLQSHPFTIFSAAPSTTTSAPTETETAAGPTNHAFLTLLIRPQSPTGFTHLLLSHARTHPTTRIRLDGPYGSSHALDMLEASSTAILIAGGSGIAVAYPLLYALLSPPSASTSPSSDTDTESLLSSPKSPARRVRLLWITHDPTHRLWIPEPKLKELEDWGLDVVICPPTSLAGRPDVKGILGEWIEESDGERGTGVVVSGPEGLVRDVRNTVARGIWRGRSVGVCVEKFGW
ncbi:hypothetical protein NX059_006407 [Plenodomus lindquistii]|nr:hypothetical protein NX059_006407 [Plenodomus lindquistii]